MKARVISSKFAAVLVLAAGAFTGCESTDGGGSSSSTTMYYGVGFHDPWYHGHYEYDYDYDVDVTPPPGRPGIGGGPRPSHPIARPPMATPRPMPSIPSAPRVSGRR